MRQYLIPAVMAVALSATAVTAQAPNRFTVGAHAGYTKFGDASALEDEPFIGVDAAYRFANFGLGGLDVGLGFAFAASRPKTRGDQFPVVAFDFGDTTFLSTVAQRVTMLQYGVQGILGQSFGPLRLYGMGGGGAYSMILDSRQNVSSQIITNGMGLLGGGLEYAVGDNFGFRFEVRDFVMLDYDRNDLDPTVAYSHDRIVRDVLPPPVPAKSTLHNIQASLVFTYVPNRRGVPEPEVQTP
jgi:opacity protein-like surface antigen